MPTLVDNDLRLALGHDAAESCRVIGVDDDRFDAHAAQQRRLVGGSRGADHTPSVGDQQRCKLLPDCAGRASEKDALVREPAALCALPKDERICQGRG